MSVQILQGDVRHRFTIGSLFSGAAGFEQGFEQAGFRTAWQCEIDKDAVSVLERHYPNVRRFRDVRDIDPATLEPVDVVVFGSPCQDMSVAGNRAGLDGERSGLYHEAVRIIRNSSPPTRPTRSGLRSAFLIRWATDRNTASPIGWPCTSLMRLK